MSQVPSPYYPQEEVKAAPPPHRVHVITLTYYAYKAALH